MISESQQKDINKFLDAGLNLYGLGKFSEAIVIWKKVLDIDPYNAVARDYIISAGGIVPEPPPPRTHSSRPAPPPARPPAPGGGSLLDEAKTLVRSGSYEDALELLEKTLEGDSGNIEAQSLVELVKGKQLKKYIDEAGDPGARPAVIKNPGDLLKFNLTREAGFIISLVDGKTTLEDIISLSGMDRFSAFRNIVRIKRLGIIS